MLSDVEKMTFEELYDRYQTDDSEIPGFVSQGVKEKEEGVPLAPMSLN